MNSRTQWMTCLTKLLLFGSYSDQTRKVILRWYIWTTIPMEEEYLYSLTLILTQKGKKQEKRKKRKTKNLSESPPLVWFVEDPRSLASCGFCFAEEYVLLVVWFGLSLEISYGVWTTWNANSYCRLVRRFVQIKELMLFVFPSLIN